MLISDPEHGLRVIRRIHGGIGADLGERASALGLLRQVRIPSFALIEDRAFSGSTLEITETFVDGIVLGDDLETVRRCIGVSVAIAIAHDLARGLSVLHPIREPTGLPARLIHGSIDLDHLIVTPTGDVFAFGLEGRRGDPQQDVEGVLAVLQSLLAGKAGTKAGTGLLQRLSQLRFDSAAQMVVALAAYLERQEVGEVDAKRVAFATELAAIIPVRSVVLDDERDDALTLGPRHRSVDPTLDVLAGPGGLGASAQVEMDDADGPTVAERLPPVPRAAATDPGLSARAARDALFTPAVPREESVPPERSVSIGNYRVVASIGRGGMGEIYLARPSVGSYYRGLVALKVLGIDDSADDESLGMFMDEASIMAQVDHPNVLKVVDFGRAKARHFLAMEYLEGRPLVRVMIDAYQREDGLDYGVIAAIGAAAARGLHAAHTALTAKGEPLRVVHRDVSPQNIFITYQGVTKVIDFGVARASQRVSKTAVGVVKGKAAYMSPEQTEGREVDARSDIFSLGVCLWEMAAGRRLFKRDSEYDTLVAVSTAPIEAATHVRGRPNRNFDRIIAACLARDREKRVGTGAELADMLTVFAASAGITDGPAAISALMQRLFGEVAAEERELIRQLGGRAATEAEADSLRRLSGVSQRRTARPEVTIVGAASGLLELDHFGDAKVARDRELAGSGDIVLRAVEAILAEHAAQAAETAQDRPNRLSSVVAAAGARTPEHTDESDPTSVVSGEQKGLRAIFFGSSEPTPQPNAVLRFGVPVGDPSNSPSITPIPTAPWVNQEPPTGQFAPASERPGSATARQPAVHSARRWRRPVGLAAAALAVVAIVVLALDVSQTQKSAPPAPPASQAVASVEPASPPVAAPAPGAVPAAAETQGSGRVLHLDDIAIQPDSEPASAQNQGQPAPAPTGTATAAGSIDRVLEDARAHGLAGIPSDRGYTLDDGTGRTLTIDRDARVVAVTTPAARGWVIKNASRGSPQVLWVGALGGGAYIARAISINDCPATVEVRPEGVQLKYRNRTIELPHGGGELRDITLAQPDFAEGLELEPLGLAFGQKRKASAALRCGIGWWGGRVVLRAMPEGHYTLRWVGEDRNETARLEIGTGTAKGWRMVRTSSRARSL